MMNEVENDNGKRLLELCASNNLCITNTQFIQKLCRKYTWCSPDGKTQNQIDYIITREEWLTSVKKARVYRTADIESDHFLLVMEMQVKLHSHKERTAKRVDIGMLKENRVKEEFQLNMHNRFEALAKDIEEPETEWLQFKAAVNEVSREVIGYTKKGSKKWMSDKTLQIMIEVGRRKKDMLESGSEESRRKFEEVRCTLNECIKVDKERALAGVCEDMEEARKKGDSKKLFAGVNKLCGKTAV